MKDYIDEGHEEGVKRYTKAEAMSIIKEIISEDLEILRDGENLENITDDRILEIGQNFYSIYKK